MELVFVFADAQLVMVRWRPPRYIRERTEEQNNQIRQKYHIIAEGDDIPPPIASFAVR